VFRDVEVLPSGVDSLTGQLQVKMRYTGTNTWWSAAINAVDIRPVTSVGQILMEWNGPLPTAVALPPPPALPAPPVPAPPILAADGLTVDAYTGWNAVPNAVITVKTTNGTLVGLDASGNVLPDLDSYLMGVQILSDATGVFHFGIQRPAGTGGAAGAGTATIEAWELEGRSYGTVAQRYNQVYTTVSPTDPIGYRRFDFNSSSSPTATGYVPVLPSSVYTTTTGYGWLLTTPVMAVDKLQSTDKLRRDFHSAQDATFQVEVTGGLPGPFYTIRALFGEPTDDNLSGGLLGGSGPSFMEGSSGDAANLPTSPTTITITAENGATINFPKPLPNVFQAWTLTLAADSNNDGVLELRFTATGGVNPYFALDALAISQGATVPVNNPQLLDPEAPAAAAHGAVLTLSALGPIVAEARARWQAFGLTEAQLATLQMVACGVTDLPGLGLASTDSADNLIVVDQRAAGRGWFIDPTPWEDSEYVLGQPPPGVDLLTVVMHEMGHALGYQDLD
ncbi:MAG: hypothetical protein NTY19_22195, partial [Planctomycetota bacterium]|nr:hypothetical protein [Planctomycetota bacterium]